jgi:hypothetical protein
MTDDNDNVLAALDAFIAGFETRSEMRPQMRTVGEVAKPPQPEHEAINNNNIQTTKTRTTSASRIYGPENFPQKKEGKKEEESFEPNVSSPKVVCGSSGLAIENIERRRATREMRWHLDHGERVPRHLCAGCRQPIDPAYDEILDLADDNRVHLADGYRCLIAWGRRWRAAARAAIARSSAARGARASTCTQLRRRPPAPVLTLPKQRTSQPHPGPCPHPNIEKESGDQAHADHKNRTHPSLAGGLARLPVAGSRSAYDRNREGIALGSR